jgi:putative component of membrane protein insertase Oxa1/YidC/SpoIIIJ protein YidD
MPTCSVYARDAVYKYGLVKGGVLAFWRILRCNPWSGANRIDPVQ